MKKILLSSFLLLAFLNVSAQDLFGFSAGQLRQAVKNEFKEVFRSGQYQDGAEYEIYLLQPDKSAYIVFEYQPSNPDVIKSIQVSGKNTSVDIGYSGLRLGDDQARVEQIAGTPKNKQAVEGTTELWNYGNNLTIEISDGVLSSIKITDNSFSNHSKPGKLPVYGEIVQILQTGSNKEIAAVLTPRTEIYYRGKVMFFGKPLKAEIEKDSSKMFSTIRQITQGLETVDPKNPYMYEESERMIPLQKEKHVMKIKTGHLIREIVFEPVGDKYLILEIHAE